jgi:oligosaccharide repeat unit polymerase
MKYIRNRSIQLLTPTIVMGGFMFLIIFSGTLNYHLLHEIYGWQIYANIYRATMYYNCGIGCMFLGSIFIFNYLSKRSKLSKYYFVWDIKSIRRVIVILFVLSTFGTIAGIIRMGTIPLLIREGVGLERTEYLIRMGIFSKLWFMNILVVILSAIYLSINVRKNYAVIAIFLLSIAQAMILAARYHVLLGLAASVFIYNQYRRKFKLIELIIFSILVLVLAVIITDVREGRFGTAYAPYYERIIRHSFPEFRDFARTTDYTQKTGNYLHGKTFVPAIITFFPRQMYEALGMDKSVLMKEFSSASYVSNLWGAKGGIRVGLLGELYINFGLPGILIGMVIFGVFIGFLDYKITTREKLDARISIDCLFWSILLYAVLGQIDCIAWLIYYYGVLLALIYLICRKKVYIRSK